MLSRPNRLPSFAVRLVLKKGKRVFVDSLQLVWFPSESSTSRFAVIVSGAIDKRATVRNRIKRLIRQGLRLQIAHVKRPVDGVIIVKQKPQSLTQSAVNNLVSTLVKRADLLTV